MYITKMINWKELLYNISTWAWWAAFGSIILLVTTHLKISEIIGISVLYGSIMGISQSAINAANEHGEKK